MLLVALEHDRLEDRVQPIGIGNADDPGAWKERLLEDLLAAVLHAIARHDESGGRRSASDGTQVGVIDEHDDVRTVDVVADVRNP